MSRRSFQNIGFRDCGSKTAFEKIAEFEAKIDTKLPEDFRKFLCEINGGVPEKQGFRCAGDSPQKEKADHWVGGRRSNNDVFIRKKFSPRMIDRFWSFNALQGDCVLRKSGKIKSDQGDTRSLVSFGGTKLFREEWIPGGNIALSVHKNHFGFVYCVEPERFDKQQTLAELNNLLIAKNFSDFLASLIDWSDRMIFRP